MLTFKILGLFLAVNGSAGCTVDRVEGSVSVLSCDSVSSLDVDASMVGPEGTVYGTVENVTVVRDSSTGKIVL